jgi:hypothetical protein
MVTAFFLRAQFQHPTARAKPVPSGDYEIAWIHTTTNAQTWERFVAGIHKAKEQFPTMEVDDSQAFLDQTAEIPEVVVSFPKQPGRLLYRWYKLSSEVNTKEWVRVLAQRDPAPLAFMGGGSSDRAIDLARALSEQAHWHGEAPLLFITTATANEVYHADTGLPERLMNVYKDRSFRFCYTNEAMARAVTDFVWRHDDLRPRGPANIPALAVQFAVASPWDRMLVKPVADAHESDAIPPAYVLAWRDDPYSLDLAEQFRAIFQETRHNPFDRIIPIVHQIPYSVGPVNGVNRKEQGIAAEILEDAAPLTGQRTLLVLSGSTQPSRRVLRSLTVDAPLIGKHVVAVTGDGILFNTLYRDRQVAWPTRDLAIPLVLFTHQNPVAWTTEEDNAPASRLPSSTDDVLLFADMARVLAEEVQRREWVAGPSDLAHRLRQRQPAFFDAEGNRRAGQGEFVLVVRPHFDGRRVSPETIYEVYTRRAQQPWTLVKRWEK